MKRDTFRTIFLSNMELDQHSYNYQKVLMTNIILYLAIAVFFGFFIVNVFINEKVLLGIVEGVFTLPTLYTWYRLRSKHDVDFASTVAVFTILIAAIATIVVAKAESFSILWSFTLPFVVFALKEARTGIKFLLLFYGIILPYLYSRVGEIFSMIEFIRFSAVSVVVIAIAYFFSKIVRDAYRLLHKSHDKLAYSNQQIQSSIHYATNIQKSFLTPHEVIAKKFQESFVIWRPKDIVSGDIYLYERNAQGTLMGVVDCTGHGVSGGFITMLVGSSFKKLAHDKELENNPAKILEALNRDIRCQLNQNRNSALSDDGLDIGLCFIDKMHKRVIFAGAKIDLICIQNAQVTTIKADKQSLGYKRSKADYHYTNHSIEVDNQSFYLYSDGIVDQVGQANHFLYGNRRLKAFILSIQEYSFEQQKQMIIDELSHYRGREPQRDDMTILGFKA
jgi:serine phosphatase RsbU (regulator of sigma subunit)